MNINEKITVKSFSVNPGKAVKSYYKIIEVNRYFGWLKVNSIFDVVSNDRLVEIIKDYRGNFFTFKANGCGYMRYMDYYDNGRILCIIKDPNDFDSVFDVFKKDWAKSIHNLK